MDRICEYIESAKKEVKSDLELYYCSMYMCLVDTGYCELKCRFANFKSAFIDFRYGTDKCCAKLPEEKYAQDRMVNGR